MDPAAPYQLNIDVDGSREATETRPYAVGNVMDSGDSGVVLRGLPGPRGVWLPALTMLESPRGVMGGAAEPIASRPG